jgi:hypothetical protein
VASGPARLVTNELAIHCRKFSELFLYKKMPISGMRIPHVRKFNDSTHHGVSFRYVTVFYLLCIIRHHDEMIRNRGLFLSVWCNVLKFILDKNVKQFHITLGCVYVDQPLV